MRAVVCTGSGPPDVLQLQEVPTPVPRDNEALIRIRAAAVAIEDVNMRRSSIGGSKKQRILGTYIAGEVDATGKDMKRYEKGEEVYGFTGWRRLGAYAEYICMPEKGAIAPKPVNMTHEEAVAVPNGGLTALPFLRDKGRVLSGHRVLVNGASGAVGTAAVQLARHFGAEVTGVCSGANAELVRSLGAAEVVDYTEEDFTETGETYDVIFDAVGKSSFARCKGSLTRRGVYLTTIPMPGTLAWMLLNPISGGKRARFHATGLRRAAKRTRDLIVLKELVEAGEFKAVIDRTYPLDETADAHRYVDMGHKKGNVVITIGDGSSV